MLRKTIVLAALAPSVLSPAAAEQGDWLVRLRGIVVAPTEQTSEVLSGFPGGQVGVENAIVPELDFTQERSKRSGSGRRDNGHSVGRLRTHAIGPKETKATTRLRSRGASLPATLLGRVAL